MGGLFSDTTRDVIVIIGLVLAVLQTVLAFKALNATWSDTKTFFGRDRPVKSLLSLLLGCLSSPSGRLVRARLVRFTGCLFAVGAITWMLTYVTPMPPDPEPPSLVQFILFMVALGSAMAEPFMFLFCADSLMTWLETNSASKTQIRKLTIFLFSLASVLLSLCVLTLWFVDSDGWARKFLTLQVGGVFFVVMMVVAQIIEEPGGVKQAFQEIKSALKRVK